MTDPRYGRVHLTLAAIGPDDDDPDSLPERIPLTGQAVLRPRLAPGGGEIGRGPEGADEIQVPLPVPCDVFEGVLTKGGLPHVTLLVPTDDWYWEIVFQGFAIEDTPILVETFAFPVVELDQTQLDDDEYMGTNIAPFAAQAWASPSMPAATERAAAQMATLLIDARAAADAAAASATSAGTSATTAGTHATTSTTKADEANDSAAAALAHADEAGVQRWEAVNERWAAVDARNLAIGAKDDAFTARDSAQGHATAAGTAATTATTKAGEASTSATSAATSATTAGTHATTATTKASEASTSAGNAASSASAASASATSAATSATTAGTHATTATTKAGEASASAAGAQVLHDAVAATVAQFDTDFAADMALFTGIRDDINAVANTVAVDANRAEEAAQATEDALTVVRAHRWVPQGDWVVGSYEAGDVVVYDGASYYAGSATSAEPPAAPWVVLAAGGGISDASELSGALTDQVDASAAVARSSHPGMGGAFEMPISELAFGLVDMSGYFAGKSDVGHKHPVSDLTATGTRSASTYLRGDGSWATPPNTTYEAVTTTAIDAGTEDVARLTTASRTRHAVQRWVTGSGATPVTAIGQALAAATSAASARATIGAEQEPWTGTQSAYNALGTKDPNRTYYIV